MAARAGVLRRLWQTSPFDGAHGASGERQDRRVADPTYDAEGLRVGQGSPFDGAQGASGGRQDQDAQAARGGQAPSLDGAQGARVAAFWPWVALAAACLAVLWPLGLTNRVLAGIDALTYFTPYWAYRMAALRAGQVPLWDPYLFLGVPFLANPQAAVLYPLHWPLSWLDPAQALVWSAILHVWLAATCAYLFGRHSLGLTRLAAVLTGLIFGLGGYTLARVENINQLNALAWFPALLWLYDETLRARDRRHALRWGLALAGVIALALLAGHTQTAFLDLAGLALYACVPLLDGLWRAWRAKRGSQDLDGDPAEGAAGHAWQRLLPLLAVVPALLLAAAQLGPALELSNLGLRTGGLPFRQAISFSLRPRLLAQSLLPPLGGGLAETYASEGYAEYVGYLGVVALMLAWWGLTGAGRRSPGPSGQARRALPWLAAAGLLLALGAYNPLYYLLWRFVPGFALFRAPARWLALYALGMAGLAGLGLDRLSRQAGAAPRATRGRRGWRRGTVMAGAACLVLVILAVTQQWPAWPVVAGWLAAGLAGLGLWRLGRSQPARRSLARGGLFALALAELWLGSRALPFTQATAPAAAAGLRNAPAALLAATAHQPPAGRDRFLSLSDIRFDPGDLAELRGLQADLLPPAATERLVRAAKQMEVLAPNLPLLWRLPAVDGYDGGVLPLARYVKLQTLFFAAGGSSPSPDGRLREGLRGIPPERLLDLTGTRYVITDKQNDLWAGDVYYDLEQPVSLAPGEAVTLDLGGYPLFSATALGIVSYLDGPGQPGAAAAEVELSGDPATPGNSRAITLTVGADTAWAQAMGPLTAGQVARAWPDWQGAGQDYLSVKALSPPNAEAACRTSGGAAAGCAYTPRSIRITALPAPGQPALVVRGLSLIDGRTGAHQSITLSRRGDVRRIYSGDVKVYERASAPGRAWLVRRAQIVPDDEAALARLAGGTFDPRTLAVITGPPNTVALPETASGQAGVPEYGADRVETVEYAPERIVLRATAAAPALLVVADAAYPGWNARVDGQPAPLLTANLMLRGVALPAGAHEITLEYRPVSWQLGRLVSLLALASCVVVLALTIYEFRH